MVKIRASMKGVVKATPSSKKEPIKPKFSSGYGGLLTEKIIITVNKNKDKKNNGKKSD